MNTTTTSDTVPNTTRTSKLFARGAIICGKRVEHWKIDDLAVPLRWRVPRLAQIACDLFHEALSFEEIAAVFGVMAALPHITFQVLTKRPGRALAWFEWVNHQGDTDGSGRPAAEQCRDEAWSELSWIDNPAADKIVRRPLPSWPLPNVWLGVSAENQETADERIPLLLQCPAAVRFVSYEPALGPLDCRFGEDLEDDEDSGVGCYPCEIGRRRHQHYISELCGRAVDWVIAGGESGPGARPPHPDWFRRVRDDCVAAGVAFFFKQWGEWAPWSATAGRGHDGMFVAPDGDYDPSFLTPDSHLVFRVGKRKAGRLLDGREWNEFPGGVAMSNPIRIDREGRYHTIEIYEEGDGWWRTFSIQKDAEDEEYVFELESVFRDDHLRENMRITPEKLSAIRDWISEELSRVSP